MWVGNYPYCNLGIKKNGTYSIYFKCYHKFSRTWRFYPRRPLASLLFQNKERSMWNRWCGECLNWVSLVACVAGAGGTSLKLGYACNKGFSPPDYCSFSDKLSSTSSFQTLSLVQMYKLLLTLLPPSSPTSGLPDRSNAGGRRALEDL